MADWVETQPAGDVDKSWQQCSLSDSGYVAAITYANQYDSIYVSTDNCETWSLKTITTGNVLRATDAVVSGDGTAIFVGSSQTNGRLWYSDDVGETWSELRPEGDLDRAWKYLCINEDGSILMAWCDTSGKLWRSEDSGANWSDVTPAAISDAGGVSMSGDGVYVAVGNNAAGGLLVVSGDGGSTWTSRTAGDAGTVPLLSSDGSVLLCSCDVTTESLLRSIDYGANWTDITPGYEVEPNYFQKVSCNSEGSVILCTAYGGDYRTNLSYDSGDSWEDTDLGYGSHAVNSDGEVLLYGHWGGRVYVVHDPVVDMTGSVSAAMPTLSGLGTVTVTGTGAVSAAMPMLDGVGFRGAAGVVYGVGSVRAAMPTLDGVGGHLIPQEMALDQRLTKARLIQWLGKTKLYGG